MHPIAVQPRQGNTSTILVRTLMGGAAVFNSVVAGTGVDRVAVQMPAWRILGVRPWADYSHRADLQNGAFLYPLSAIGGCALSMAAAFRFLRNGRAPRAAGTAVLLSVLLAATGLALTAQAAPQIRSIRRVGDNPIELQRAFNAFDWWGRYRTAAQFAAFCANIWALVSLTDGNAGDSPGRTP